MVNNNIKTLLKRAGNTQKQIKRRGYNQVYYGTTKQRRKECYRFVEKTSVSFY